MKIKLYVIAIFCLILNINAFSQKGYAEKINQLNGKGQKEGLWKEDINKYWRAEIYYHNGKKNGLYKSFSIPSGELSCFGEYKNDTIIGTWYYFGSYGHLIMIFNDFSKNTFVITNEGDGGIYTPDYKCYMVSYYPNGNKKDEGIILWNEGESPESDFSVEYGEWKYYAETGELTKTKIFK